jgi:hypothetical protein
LLLRNQKKWLENPAMFEPPNISKLSTIPTKKPTPSHETPRWTIKFQVPKSLPQNLAMLAMTWG